MKRRRRYPGREKKSKLVPINKEMRCPKCNTVTWYSEDYLALRWCPECSEYYEIKETNE